jgi:hypothetical protein
MYKSIWKLGARPVNAQARNGTGGRRKARTPGIGPAAVSRATRELHRAHIQRGFFNQR